MYSQRQWTTAITNLMRKTSDGEIEWDICEVPAAALPNRDDRAGRSFEAIFRNKRYRAYTYQQRQYDGDSETFYWAQSNNLDILDRSDRHITSSGFLPINYDLLDMVEKKFAFSQQALGDLLDD